MFDSDFNIILQGNNNRLCDLDAVCYALNILIMYYLLIFVMFQIGATSPNIPVTPLVMVSLKHSDEQDMSC